MAWGDLSAALHVMTPNLVAIPVLLAGTDEQRQKMLPSFCDAAFPKASAAFVEPDIRFDLHRPATTATANGDTYTLNGAKAYVPLAVEAETLLVETELPIIPIYQAVNYHLKRPAVKGMHPNVQGTYPTKHLWVDRSGDGS